MSLVPVEQRLKLPRVDLHAWRRRSRGVQPSRDRLWYHSPKLSRVAALWCRLKQRKRGRVSRNGAEAARNTPVECRSPTITPALLTKATSIPTLTVPYGICAQHQGERTQSPLSAPPVRGSAARGFPQTNRTRSPRSRLRSWPPSLQLRPPCWPEPAKASGACSGSSPS